MAFLFCVLYQEPVNYEMEDNFWQRTEAKEACEIGHHLWLYS